MSVFWGEGILKMNLLPFVFLRGVSLLTRDGGGTQLSAAQNKMTYFRHWGQWDPDAHPHVLGRV